MIFLGQNKVKLQKICFLKWFALSFRIGSVGLQEHKKCTINAHYHYPITINLESLPVGYRALCLETSYFGFYFIKKTLFSAFCRKMKKFPKIG